MGLFLFYEYFIACADMAGCLASLARSARLAAIGSLLIRHRVLVSMALLLFGLVRSAVYMSVYALRYRPSDRV